MLSSKHVFAVRILFSPVFFNCNHGACAMHRAVQWGVVQCNELMAGALEPSQPLEKHIPLHTLSLQLEGMKTRTLRYDVR